MPAHTSPAADLPAPATPGRRERAKADKRARILAAARHRLESQGYEGMTVAQVAQDADVATGTVFQYAATKAELLLMVTAHQWRQVFDTLLADLDDVRAPQDAVLRLLTPLVRASQENPEVNAAVARELMFGSDGEHRREVHALVTRLEQVIARILREDGAGERAEAAARLVVSGALTEINRTRTGVADGATTTDRVAELVAIALAGARSRPGA